MNERAKKLRAALLQEWQRAKVEYANLGPSPRTVKHSQLEAHILVMSAVLEEDERLEQRETDAARASAVEELSG